MKTRMKHYLSLTNNLQMSNNRFEFQEMFETNDGGQKTVVLRAISRPKVNTLLIFSDKNRRNVPKRQSL